jgi:hypothetical protein
VHSLLSGSVLLLQLRGRTSRRLITVPVQYAADGDDLVVLSGRPEAKRWWRNIDAGDPVSLLLRGRTLAGRAWHIDPDANAESARAAARAIAVWRRRFPRAAGRLGLPDPSRVAITLLRVETDSDPQLPPTPGADRWRQRPMRRPGRMTPGA